VVVHCSFGWYSLHDIVYPGHAYNRFPKWLRNFDNFCISKVVRLLNFVVVPIHKWIYKKAYKEAVNMFPHLKVEICVMADYVELLEDFFDYRKYWKKL